jgi:hypothetical protein
LSKLAIKIAIWQPWGLLKHVRLGQVRKAIIGSKGEALGFPIHSLAVLEKKIRTNS